MMPVLKEWVGNRIDGWDYVWVRRQHARLGTAAVI